MSNTSLHELLEVHWEDGCIDSGHRLAESGRVFSLRPADGEEAVFIRPEACPEWPQGTKKCDAVVISRSRDEKTFSVVLVELKGGHVENALNQIEITCRAMCLNSNARTNKHGFLKNKLNQMGWKHSGRVYGIIIGKKSIAQRQQHFKKLLQSLGLRVLSRTENIQGKSINDLHRLLGVEMLF